MAAKHVFCFDLAAEKVGQLSAKPFFEKYSEIRSYDVYLTIDGKPTFVEEIVYEDMKAFRSMQRKLGEPEIQRMVDVFFSYVVNLQTKFMM